MYKYITHTIFRRHRIASFAGLVILTLLITALSSSFHKADAHEWISDTFNRLETIRDQRREQVVYLVEQAMQSIEEQAKNPDSLNALLAFDSAFNHHGSESPAYSEVEEKYAIKYRDYIEALHYYDLFLINAEGLVIYTVKREEDFGSNVLNNGYEDTLISKCFQTALSDGISFVTYNFYDPSRDIASFIGAVIRDESGDMQGVLVIQLSIEHVNSILSDFSNMGRTGESYLVDNHKRMLTSSRFLGESAILSQVVQTHPVEAALLGQTGFMITEDYRGEIVFSAYSGILVGQVQWAILVEIDQDEVILNLSGPEKEALFDEITQWLDKSPNFQRLKPTAQQNQARYQDFRGKKRILVQTGELKTSTQGELLFTTGVSTCTAVIVGGKDLPGHLAHLAPVDKAYELGYLTYKVWLRDRSTDLIDDLLMEIESWAVQDDIEDLHVNIFATHVNSLPNILVRLTGYGFKPSKIRFVRGLEEGYMTVLYDHAPGVTYAWWHSYDNQWEMKLGPDLINETESIGDAIRNLIQGRLSTVARHSVARNKFWSPASTSPTPSLLFI